LTPISEIFPRLIGTDGVIKGRQCFVVTVYSRPTRACKVMFIGAGSYAATK